ncbi:MAG: HD domain-containing protein [Succinivibrio sp.]|nr:HD domain-containing protein [Succinivibrio sp.]
MNFLTQVGHRLWTFKLIFIVLAILLDFFLRDLCYDLRLPLWFDSLGIMLATFCLGTTGGMLTAFGTSLAAGFNFGFEEFWYVIPGLLIAVVTGIFCKRLTFSTLGDALGLTLSLVIMCVLVCVPINFAIHDGMTGMFWGDAVILYLDEHGFAKSSSFIGQLYVEFLDKAVTVIIFYALVHHFACFVRLRSFFYHQEEKSHKLHDLKRLAKLRKARAQGLLGLIGLTVMGAALTYADPAAAVDYNAAYAQLQANDPDHNVLMMQQTVYDSTTGLICGEANTLSTTPDGSIWVGTYAGLYRYNGKEFKICDNLKQIRSVISLYTDKLGQLWVGTNGQGVMMCHNDTIISAITSSEGLPSDNVRAICADAEDMYYILTTQGLVYINPLTNTVVHQTDLLNTQLVSLAASHHLFVGAVSNDGVLTLMQKGKILQSFIPDSPQDRYSAVGFDAQDNLYAMTTSGFLRKFTCDGLYYSLAEEYCNPSISEVKSIQSVNTSGGELIFICADSGIFFLKDAMLEQLKADNFDNSIESCVQDYQDNLWFASSRLGLLKLAHTPVSNIFQSAKLEPKVVNAIEKWDGLLYIGTDEGLTVIEPLSGQTILNPFTELLGKLRIRDLRCDAQGYLWVCTYGRGVYRLARSGNYRHYTAQDGLFGDKVRVVFEYSPSEIIVAGTHGYSVIDRQGQLFSPKEVQNLAPILGLNRDSEGTLYACTNGQGIAVIKNHKVDHFITQKDGLLSDVVMRIVQGTTKDLFFVVTGNGLCLLDPEMQVRPLDNFPYYDNFDVLKAQDGLLFVTGSSGIYVINESALLQGANPLPYVRLDSRSGLNGMLTANSWNYEDEQHNLYLAGSNGVFKLNTYAYHQQSKPYRLSLRDLATDHEHFTVGSGLPTRFARQLKKLTFYPEIINFSSENPLVGHYLEGLEDSKYTQVRFSDFYEITYTNLPPGAYKLHVAVFKDDGSTKLAETTFAFEKESAFYDSEQFFFYFYGVAALMVAYLTFFLVSMWNRRRQEADRMMLEMAQQQVRMGDETILTIAQALDARDQRTQQHSKRVSQYSVMIAKELGFDHDECENLRKVALLHDIGKIGIPDRILNKPGRLTDEEYAIMKSHVVIGADILKNFRSFSNVADGVRYHHERYDGKGYVQGLKGEEIPLYGRIIAVADTFDAMTANRVYRHKLDIQVVLAELERCKGTQFDPRCAEIMIKLVKDGKVNLAELYADEAEAEQSKEGKAAEEAKNEADLIGPKSLESAKSDPKTPEHLRMPAISDK